jgi:hypothetical protein
MTERFVPPAFAIPLHLHHPLFQLRPLRATDVEADFAAVTASADRLRAWGTSALGLAGWPREGFTLAENLRDLQRHEAEFISREAFAYTVLRPDAAVTLGCVYFYPDAVAQVRISMWIRTGACALQPVLQAAVREWVRTAWPFERVWYHPMPPCSDEASA